MVLTKEYSRSVSHPRNSNLEHDICMSDRRVMCLVYNGCWKLYSMSASPFTKVPTTFWMLKRWVTMYMQVQSWHFMLQNERKHS